MVARRRLRWVGGVTLVMAVAVALRFGPLYWSPLPFNPDGIIHSQWARDTVSAGRFPLARMAVDDLGFVGFLAVVSQVTGVRPLHIAQPVSGLVGAGPVLLAIPVAGRLARAHGWTPGRVQLGGLLAGALLAVNGLYLHRSMPTDEQTLGLLFVPLAGLAVWRAVDRGERRWLAVALPVLLVLPPVHNLDTVVAALGLTLLVVLGVGPGRSRAGVAVLVAVAGLFWIYSFGYFQVTELLTPATVIQSDRVMAIPGLFLAWLLLTGFSARWFVSLGARWQRFLVVGLFAVLFLLLAVNAAGPVFPGTPTTEPVLLWLLAPLVVIAVLAAWSTPLASRPGSDGLAIVALLGGPLALGGLSLTAGLTPEYLVTAYRTQTFLHFPVAVLAGLGTVHVLAGLPLDRPALRSAAVGLVLLSAAASLPVAFAGLELMPYKGVTTTGELGAAGFASSYAAGPWAADDHIARISPYHRWDTDARRGPAYTWLTGGPAPACLLVSQHSWTTTGAQFYPQPAVATTPAAYRGLLGDRHVVFRSAGADPIAISLPVRAADGGC